MKKYGNSASFAIHFIIHKERTTNLALKGIFETHPCHFFFLFLFVLDLRKIDEACVLVVLRLKKIKESLAPLKRKDCNGMQDIVLTIEG